MSINFLTKFLPLCLCALIISSGCNYQIEKQRNEDNEAAANLAQKPELLSFQILKDNIFIPKCLACHSGGDLDVSLYSSVKSNLSEIERKAIKEKSMPKGKSLSAGETALLSSWINMGAPEFAKGEVPPTPSPPLVLEPTYASIYKNIIAVKCLICHSAGGKAEHIPLGTYSDLIDSPREIVLPGNPDESGIIIAISRGDEKRMPPASVGASPLNEKEIAVIYEWIKSGAME